MDSNVWIYCACVMVFAVTGGQSACPTNCSCSGTNVTCTGFTFMQGMIPESTTWLKLRSTNLTIPTTVFAGFKNLTYLEFSDSFIQKIAPYAFTLLNATDIKFNRCIIEGIDSFAFSHIERLESVEFNQTVISYIDSFAFSEISYLGVLTFSLTTITELRHKAINGIDYFGILSVLTSTIDTWGEKAVSDTAYLGIVSIIYSRIHTLYPEAFSNLTEVGQIGLVSSQVNETKAYAFTQIGKLGMFSTYQSWFNVIRRYAISNNTLISRLSFTFSTVEEVESFAVTQNERIDSLNLYNMSITRLRSFAFNDTSVEYADFQYINIRRLDCGTIEYLQDNVQKRFTFTPVNVTCDSNICWLFHRNRTRYLQTIFSQVKCSFPISPATSALGSLYGTPPENLPFGCNNYNYTADFTCNGSPRSADRDISLIVALAVSFTTFIWLTRFGKVTVQ